MNRLDELKDDVAALKAGFDARDREWRKLCRKHGGTKAAIALAWGRDEELARSIRAVMIPRNAAKAAYEKKLKAQRIAGYRAAVESCLKAMNGKEAAHVG